ncbi:substrate-binding periplasmic protein [Kordiimonas gwangyangensis]|uniref:substrate-binding periplasmic protein n=1 Tax=Kordiimonas gwangyangensis TaxID=288022 RepID=UPI000ABD3C03|nr:transporter substrate-binding domain-containing protein [Kordiimonas gwangyangensis]
MTHFPKTRLLIATLFAFVSSAGHAADERVTVVTDIWPPYISAKGDEPGSAARMLELLLYLEGVEADWRYLPYELSLAQVSAKEELLSFPYFRSPEREEKVLFSAPIFSVTSHLYYNRQYTPDAAVADLKPQTARKGRVAGYSYGSKIDTLLVDAKLYTSERDALTALFNHEIDLLPMTEGVMTALLLSHYPDRLQLIRPLPDMTDTSSLHVIAAKTPAGEQAIAKVNRALEKAASLGLDSCNRRTPACLWPLMLPCSCQRKATPPSLVRCGAQTAPLNIIPCHKAQRCWSRNGAKRSGCRPRPTAYIKT